MKILKKYLEVFLSVAEWYDDGNLKYLINLIKFSFPDYLSPLCSVEQLGVNSPPESMWTSERSDDKLDQDVEFMLRTTLPWSCGGMGGQGRTDSFLIISVGFNEVVSNACSVELSVEDLVIVKFELSLMNVME